MVISVEEVGSSDVGSSVVGSEKPLMREFMLESVKYWIAEYHIDGFRFDLMGVHDIETMQQIRAEVNKIDPSIYIYGESLHMGGC